MSIDAGDRWAEYQIKEREEVGRYMYEHQDDYVSSSRHKKTVDQLTKAKKLIHDLLYVYKLGKNELATARAVAEAEQFLKEITQC